MSYPLARVIIFTHQFARMLDFYRQALGMTVVEESEGWADLASGGCRLAIHAAGADVTVGPDFEGPHKLAFFAADVVAARTALVARGVTMGPIHDFGDLQFCDGSDPDENRFQLSNRR